MDKVNAQMVETLKSEGFYFAAGALACSLQLPMAYGCHYGMRSDKAFAQSEFIRGYQAR